MIRKPLTLAALIALAAAPLCAADGRVPIAAAPYTISAPGHYYLTRDLTVASGTAITISSNDVTLDLNGHTLTNTDLQATASSVIATSASFTGVRITGGRVRGGFNGIFLNGPAGGDYRVDRMQVTDSANTGIRAGANAAPEARVVLEQNEIVVPEATAYSGITLTYVKHSRISDLAIRGGNYSLFMMNSTGVTIENSTLGGTSGICLYVASGVNTGLHVRNNTLSDCATTGMYVNSNHAHVEGNMISACGGAGIDYGGDYGTITGNTISQATTYGLRLRGAVGNSISRNTLSGTTGGPGIHLQGSSQNNSIDWNVVSENSGAGVLVSDAGSTGNIYSYNRFISNGAANNFNAGNVSAGGNNAGGANF